ncbi:MAG: PolC-type DNA polymerase III [Bulleidia sp.]
MSGKIRKFKGKSLVDFPDEYVVIDIETTGMASGKDSIIELGAVRYVNGQETERFSHLVKPDFWKLYYSDRSQVEPVLHHLNDYADHGIMIQIQGTRSLENLDLPYEMNCPVCYVSPFITELTGISNHMLDEAPLMEEVLPAFLDFVKDTIVIGHNVNFDVNFIYDTVIKYTGKPFTNDFIDTLRLSRKLLPQLSHHRLQDLAEYYDIDYSHAHRAVEDVVITQQVFEHMRSLVRSRYGSEQEFLTRACRRRK